MERYLLRWINSLDYESQNAPRYVAYKLDNQEAQPKKNQECPFQGQEQGMSIKT